MDPLAPQDQVPLVITWVASGLLVLITTLLHPVLLYIFVIAKSQLPRTKLVQRCYLLPSNGTSRKLFLHHLDQDVSLLVHLTLCTRHLVIGGWLIADSKNYEA